MVEGINQRLVLTLERNMTFLDQSYGQGLGHMLHTLLGKPHASHSLDPNRRRFHRTPEDSGIPHDTADHVDAIGRHGIRPHTHRRAAEKYRQDLPGPPKGYIANLDLSCRSFPVVFHAVELEVKLFSPGIDRR